MNPNDPKIKALSPLLRRVRRDVTAIKKADGTTAWTREPLTKELVAKHINGGPARGVSPVLEGQNTTLVGLLDFDSHGGETPWPEMTAAAGRVHESAALFGLRGVPFRSSGGRGIHLIFLWDEPQDAASVRACLADILASCGLANGAKGVAAAQVEVFPKQDEVPFGGFGNQFILPLAGKSEPLDPVLGFEPAGKDAVLALRWPSSDPVPPLLQEGRQKAAAGADALLVGSVPLATLRSALAAIPNDGDAAPDYDEWRDIIFGLHHATGGSDEGLKLAIEFSARNPAKHDEKFLRERVWKYAGKRAGGKTVRTVTAKARKHGWQQDEADWFEALDGEQGDDGGADPFAAPAGAGAAGAGGAGGQGTAGQNAPGKTGEAGSVVAGAGVGIGPVAPRALPNFRRDKQGAILADAPNLHMAVGRSDLVGGLIGYDEFRDELLIDRSEGGGQWQPFGDEDYFFVRVRLESIGFKVIGREAIRDAVHAIATLNRFDSARLWLSGLQWDGTPRIARFLADYFGAEDSPYTTAVSLYLWTALAGRTMKGGVKADMVPIAVGSQGIGKSTGIEAIAPAVDYHGEISFAESEDDIARRMRGKQIIEFGELRGLHTKELEAIKAFISRTHEEWVPKFKEFATKYPRRCVFFGSTNQDEFLADPTGNRRWLPFDAGITGPVRVDLIREQRDQLWAEGKARFEAEGVLWQEAEQLAQAQHSRYEMRDQWADQVAQWLKTPGFGGDICPSEKPFITTLEILCGALGFDVRNVSRREEMRLGSVMRHLGYERGRQLNSGSRTYGWQKPTKVRVKVEKISRNGA